MKQISTKILIIITAVLFASFFVLYVLSSSFTKPPDSPSIIRPTATPTHLRVNPTLPIVTPPSSSLDKILVSGVSVNNFYRKGERMNQYGDVLIEENKEFSIEYQHPFKLFIIAVLSTPFDALRIKAENAFLSRLGISKEDACALNVQVGTPFFVDPQYAMTSYPLSFCKKPQR